MSFAEDRATAIARKKVALAALNIDKPKKQKFTEERIADLQQLNDVMHHLFNKGCLVHSFHSTDDKPVLIVEPDANFKRLIVGMVVHLDERNKNGVVVQILNHVVMGGVKVTWLELEIKKGVSHE